MLAERNLHCVRETTMHLHRLPIRAEASAPATTLPVWRPEFAVLIGLVLIGHSMHLSLLPIRGEESRWARVGMEMIASGDWVVPRQQGEPFLSRPPLHSWIMAAAAWCIGEFDVVAVRLPSVVAVLATSVLVYCFASSFVGRVASFVAAVSFATMGQVLELGRRGETDALLTLFLSGALFVWHYGWQRHWPAAVCWGLGYALAALAALTKSPLQAAAYFAGGTIVYLSLAGEWKRILTRGHAAGLALGVAVFALWQVPFALAMGWDGVYRLWFWEVGLRFEDRSAPSLAWHMLTYPFEVLVCMLPWSIVLMGFAKRGIRRQALAVPQVRFLVACISVAFASCWLVRGAQTRYLMSMYPCFAVLFGYVIDRGLAESQLAVDRLRRRNRSTATVAGAMAISLGLIYSEIVLPALARSSEDMAQQLHIVRRKLPPDARLVSFGPVHHIFAFHYREPIPMLAWPQRPADVDQRVEWFCFHAKQGEPRELPFSWEPFAELSCDRIQHADPRETMIIGRRQPSAEQVSASRTPMR